MRSLLALLAIALAGCPATPAEPDGGSIDSGLELPDAGGMIEPIDGGVMSIFFSCVSSEGRMVVEMQSITLGACAQLLFREDAGNLWPRVTPFPGYGLQDARYGPCRTLRIIEDGGLPQAELVPTEIAGSFEVVGRAIGGVPVVMRVLDGGLASQNVYFSISSDTRGVRVYCPGQ